MGDFYHQFLSSMSGAGGHPPLSPDDFQHPQFPGMPMPLSATSMQNPYQSLGYFAGINDPTVYGASKPGKGRRKSSSALGSGIEHVKHRRTRSGCFMCRSRRVKCDETRPVCERCKKGNRECVYPDPPTSKTSSQSSASKDASAQKPSPSSSNEIDEDINAQDTKLETILDDEEFDNEFAESALSQTALNPNTMSPTALTMSGRGGSETPSQELSKASSPTSSTVTSASMSVAPYHASDYSQSPVGRHDWSHLPPDFQKHLEWFVEHMSYLHYCLPIESNDFLKTILPNMAVNYEPLLNAVVGFAAYHQTLGNPNGKLEDFLHYYNKSVTLLLGFLKRKEKYNVSTLLTILQLATIEEYLGDWINIMGHQKAAFEIITKTFDLKTVMQTSVSRACANWYMRFDNFVALMGGFPTDLPREWFSTRSDWYTSQIAAEPEVLKWKYARISTSLYVITHDMSILFARGSRGQISPEDFNREHEKISARLQEWKDGWEEVLLDPQHVVTNWPNQKPVDPEDIVNPYTPGVLYEPPLFPTTLLQAEWHSISIMHKCQSSNMPPEQLFRELAEHAYGVCTIFEAIEFWPGSPEGAIIMAQAYISIASLFLPQDERHRKWLKRKFATIEMVGHIHPISLRSKVAEIFQEPSLARWWLPNDEDFSPILQSVRSFADERNAAAMNAQQESLREIRHIFAKLEISK